MESIANYKIDRTISINGPSSIYIATHIKLGRKTFLKVYDGDDSTIIERFEREAKIVADLNNDAIVQIYDFGESEGKFYISMEYVEGQNLAEFLQESQPEWNVIQDVSRQITQALAILHAKGYIHRDLKPENILISADHKIKLTDFGITLHESLNRVTSDGALLGTPLYMSPEQINNLELTAASDVFSLGVILYQLASHIHPFEAEQYGQVFSRILTEQPQSLNKLSPELPDWYTTLIERLLIKEAHKRPGNAQLVLKVFSEHSSEFSADEPITTVPKSTRQFAYPIAFILIILFVILFIFVKDIWFPQPLPLNISDSLQKDTTSISEKVSLEDSASQIQVAYENKPEISGTEVATNGKIVKSFLPTTLLIKTFPWCNVYLDYKLVDKTPMTEILTVKPGRYMLSLQNPAYPSLSQEITVEPNKNNEFVFNLDSSFMQLNVQVIPWGKLYIDGKYITTTPLQQPIYLTREDHLIEIKNDYYRTWSDSIRWSGNQKIQMLVELKEKL